jgi:hypothetical protein
VLVAAPSALAVPTVTRAELNGGWLGVEGRGAVPTGAVTVASIKVGESTITRSADSSWELPDRDERLQGERV